MSKLGPWEQAAMNHEVLMTGGDVAGAAALVGGIVLGMSIATRHPEYAQAAIPISQQGFRESRPDAPLLEDTVEEFIRAVPIAVSDEASNGSSP